MRIGAFLRALLGAAIVAALSSTTSCHSVSKITAPAISVRNIQLHGLSGGVADVVLEMLVDNANEFDITLIELTAGIALGGVQVGLLDWSGEFECPGERASVLRIPLRLAVGEHHGLFTALADGGRPLRHALQGESTFARGMIRRTYPLVTKGEIGT